MDGKERKNVGEEGREEKKSILEATVRILGKINGKE